MYVMYTMSERGSFHITSQQGLCHICRGWQVVSGEAGLMSGSFVEWIKDSTEGVELVWQ